MLVEFNDESYDFNLEAITVSQAKIIKDYAKFSILGLQEALEEIDPDALRCMFWLMQVQSGKAIPIQRVQDFKIFEFAKALQDAFEKENEEEESLDGEAKPPEVSSPKADEPS